MSYIERLLIRRRWLSAAGSVRAPVVFSVVLFAGAYLALTLGWHPLAATTFGCALHKHFHSYHIHIASQQIIANTDCIKVTLFGRDTLIRDVRRINPLRSWLAARADLWEEN